MKLADKSLFLLVGGMLAAVILVASFAFGSHPASALSPGQMTMVEISTYGGEVDIQNGALAEVGNPQHHAVPNTLVCKNNAGNVSTGLPKTFVPWHGWSFGRPAEGGILRCVSTLPKGDKLDLTIAVLPQ